MGSTAPAKRRPFLTARWNNLVLVTYAVPPQVLDEHLPPGCQLDLIDGQAFVSLVAFDFLDCRVWGVSWPGFSCFPEVNLRYYVRRGEQRGVAFIRELVPQRWVCLLARWFYNEPYFPAQMRSVVTSRPEAITVEHTVTYGGAMNRLQVTAGGKSFVPPPDSREHFFKEHQWGFNRSRRNHLVQYEVQHPVWAVYGQPQLQLQWDWARVYGDKWWFLQEATPVSLILAVGSEIAVYPKSLPPSL